MNKYLHYIIPFVFALLSVAEAKAQIAYNEQERTLIEKNASTNRPQLMQAIKHAGLTPILTSPGPYTFFVPSEESVRDLINATPDQARTVLSAHILEGVIREEDLHNGAKLKNLNGQTLTVCRKKDKVLINGIRITQSNQQTSNGIYHSINGLIKPSNP